MKVYKDCHPQFLINEKIDTLFLIEEYIVEEGTFLGKIWNTKNGITYRYRFNRIDYPEHLFSN